MRVLGLGNCTLDHFAIVDRFLEPDSTKEVLQFSQQGGGAVATAMVALSRWGASTTFLGKAGDDARGLQIVRTLSDEGVDTSHFVLQPKAVSQLSMVTIEQSSGRKQCVFTHGSVETLAADEVDEAWLDQVDLVLVDGHHVEAELKLMAAARRRGIRVMIDAQTNSPTVAEAVAHCDILVASERFASQFAGVGELKSLCAALLEKGPSVVVVTLGDEGCACLSKDDAFCRQEAADVPVVDTTGAGDVFHAGVIYGLLSGWNLKDTARFANAAAGLTCTGIGARGPIPSLDAIEEQLKRA